MDVMGTIGGYLPKIDAQAATSFIMIAIVTLLVVIVVGCGFAWWAYSYIQKKKFNITIQLFEKINGKYKPTKIYKAMELNYSDSGEKAIFIDGLKRYRAKPTCQMGDNKYWLAIDEEGSLINIDMEDVDFLLREMRVETTETESRANRIAFQKALGDRLKDKEGFWAKYGETIMKIVYIVLISIAIVFILSKVGNIVSAIAGLIDKMSALQDGQANILTGMDNIVNALKTCKATV